MFKVIRSVTEWRELRRSFGNKTLGFVPTMGNLHAGHLSLLEKSLTENDITVLSCFVNPTQFNNANDFAEYPRTVQADMDLCELIGVDYFFLPNEVELYPDDYAYTVLEKKTSCLLEGQHRLGHFEGMLTIVLKLLLLIKSDKAYFGEKDYQQLQLIRKMVEAFFMETDIVACPTIRDEFNVALSSRNAQLTAEQLQLSRYFPEYLVSNRSCAEITDLLSKKGFLVDYIEEHQGRRFGAVRLGDVRLIDNIEVSKSC